jgi:mono/diheme cytochrome c family protein
MLKPLLLVSAVVLFGITASSALGPSPQDTAAGKKDSAKAADKAQARAKEIYNVDCAICHGETGDGKTDLAKDMQLSLSDFSDPKTFAGKTDQEIFKIIRDGKDKMPAEGTGRAKDDELNNLVAYLRSLSKAQAADAPKPTN